MRKCVTICDLCGEETVQAHRSINITSSVRLAVRSRNENIENKHDGDLCEHCATTIHNSIMKGLEL
jgi:hypothetical protein